MPPRGKIQRAYPTGKRLLEPAVLNGNESASLSDTMIDEATALCARAVAGIDDPGHIV
jgi:hypothetical protein